MRRFAVKPIPAYTSRALKAVQTFLELPRLSLHLSEPTFVRKELNLTCRPLSPPRAISSNLSNVQRIVRQVKAQRFATALLPSS